MAARVEPVPGAPAATAALAAADGDDDPADRALVVADYHAGIEAGLRREGVVLPENATGRRERLLALVAETGAERVLFLGDLGDSVGDPGDAERAELAALFDALDVPATLVPGNHDGGLADLDLPLAVARADGLRVGDVGFAHGHTWPAREVLEAEVVCVAHEHPTVRIEDSVGGSRVERVWLRGRLDPAPFEAHFETDLTLDAELVVFPAFNERSGGTWVNEEQDFLSPFLPEALADGQAYLLDGTRLGDYRRV